MILIYLRLILALEDSKKYYIETGDQPLKRLYLSKMAAMVARKSDIEKLKDEWTDIVSIIKLSESDYNIKLGEHYLRKNSKGSSVVLGDQLSENTVWTLDEHADNMFNIKIGGECVQIVKYASKTKGHNLNVEKCDGGVVQKFRFVEIPDSSNKSDKLVPVETLPTEKKEETKPVEVPIVEPEIPEKKEIDLPVEPLNDTKPLFEDVRGGSKGKGYSGDNIDLKIGERMKQKLIINSEGKFSEIVRSDLLDPPSESDYSTSPSILDPTEKEIFKSSNQENPKVFPKSSVPPKTIMGKI